MAIPLYYAIGKSLAARKGELTISNMGAQSVIDFHSGLDVSDMLARGATKTNAKRGNPAQHPDFMLTLEFLMQQIATHPERLEIPFRLTRD